jgi:hypothetical protein
VRRFCLALLLIGAGAAAPAAPHERYFPLENWRNADDAAHHEAWYGGQLRAMAEPILSRREDRSGFRRRFRMLVLPTFHRPYAIRVDELASGAAHVRIVRLTGRGGYGPGEILEQESYTLTADQAARLDGDIEASGLASAPPRARAACTDGAQLVFELVAAQANRFVDRHQCSLNRALETLVWRIDGLRRTVGSDLAEYRAGPARTLRMGD